MWERVEEQLALLELLASGRLPYRKVQAEAWEQLAQVGWARRAGRARELELVAPDKVSLVLERFWPSWRDAWDELQREDLPPTPEGHRELQQRTRSREVVLPDRVNQRTAAALLGAHSKASARATGGEGVTRDALLRMRPSRGLCVERGPQAVDACELAALLGEVVLTERALLDGTKLGGVLPRAVLSVENAGPFVDMCVPDGWLAVHVPGWNVRAPELLMRLLPGVPWVHFGDLDENGLRIVRKLQELRPGLRWLVPSWWGERLATHALAKPWPAGLVEAHDPPLVQELARLGQWLEQEVVALDPRLSDALEGELSRAGR